MDEPTRLIDDPNFLAQTGIDLSAEAATLTVHALPALQVATLGAIATGAPLLTGTAVSATAAVGGTALVGVKAIAFGFVLGTSVGVGVGVAGHSMWTQSSAAQPIALGAVHPPSMNHQATINATQLAEPTPRPAMPSAEDMIAAAPKNPARAPTNDAVIAPPTAPSQSHAGSLGAQMALYERGALALKNGRFDVAAAEFRLYLQQFPSGTMATETQLSLLQSLLGGKHGLEAAALASQLLQDKTLQARHLELQRAQVRGLVMGKACSSAQQIASKTNLPLTEQNRLLGVCRTR